MENSKQLAIETLVEANGYIKKVISGIDYIVESFLSGREDLALNSFANLVDGIQWLIDVIDLTKSTTNELKVEFEDNRKVIDVINEMNEAFENRDYVLVGDLLNYEFKPLMEEWNEKFEVINSQIKG